MAQLVTVGREYFKGYGLKLHYGVENVFDSRTGHGEYFRMILVSKGAGIIRIGSRRRLFTAPVVFCFNEADEFTLESANCCEAQAIWFDPRIINDSLDFDKLRKRDDELTVTEVQDIYWLDPFRHSQDAFSCQLDLGPDMIKNAEQFFHAVKDELELQRDMHWPCRSRTYLIELLFLLSQIKNPPEAVKSLPLNERTNVEDIILYLHTNYTRKVSIKELTSVFLINRTTLTKLFSSATGMPVMAYIIRLRVHLASQMLKDTLLPVSEIIERVGFNDATHFWRMFRKHYGCSPTEYREKNCWMLK